MLILNCSREACVYDSCAACFCDTSGNYLFDMIRMHKKTREDFIIPRLFYINIIIFLFGRSEQPGEEPALLGL